MKVALVTGASGGIGKAVALKFIKEGYFVVGTYNKGKEKIDAFLEELKENNLSDYFFPIKADLCDEKEVNAVTEKVLKDFGHVDAIIHSAGVDLYKLFNETTVKEWDYVFNVNVKSAFIITKNLLDSMLERKTGKIIFISSVWGKVGACMETVYSASKATLIGLTKALSKEVSPNGINVNCVCPGVIDTPMNDCFNAIEKAQILSEIPSNRFGKPEEVAELVYFLCSESAEYINGQIITQDGGYTL